MEERFWCKNHHNLAAHGTRMRAGRMRCCKCLDDQRTRQYAARKESQKLTVIQRQALRDIVSNASVLFTQFNYQTVAALVRRKLIAVEKPFLHPTTLGILENSTQGGKQIIKGVCDYAEIP